MAVSIKKIIDKKTKKVASFQKQKQLAYEIAKGLDKLNLQAVIDVKAR